MLIELTSNGVGLSSLHYVAQGVANSTNPPGSEGTMIYYAELNVVCGM